MLATVGSATSDEVDARLRFHFTSCVFLTPSGEPQRWGDDDGSAIRAFQAGETCVADVASPCSGAGCADLPTTDPRYWSNVGRGVVGGIWPGVTLYSGCRSVASDSTTCPRVASGRGPFICPLGLARARELGLMPNPDPTELWCPPSLYVDVSDLTPTYACPGFTFNDSRRSDDVRRACEALFVCSAVFAIFEAATFASRCGTEVDPEDEVPMAVPVEDDKYD